MVRDCCAAAAAAHRPPSRQTRGRRLRSPRASRPQRTPATADLRPTSSSLGAARSWCPPRPRANLDQCDASAAAVELTRLGPGVGVYQGAARSWCPPRPRANLDQCDASAAAVELTRLGPGVGVYPPRPAAAGGLAMWPRTTGNRWSDAQQDCDEGKRDPQGARPNRCQTCQQISGSAAANKRRSAPVHSSRRLLVRDGSAE
jgi:hypothetical protein